MSEHELREDDLAALTEQALEQEVAAQRERIAAFEQEFVPMRRRYERLRGWLRTLEAERERRRREREGDASAYKPIPKRSITVADVLEGRERNVPLDLPLHQFAFTSMRRQPLVLHPQGETATQRLTFYRLPGPETAEAQSFGEARRLREAGWQPGAPGISLNRMEIYYPDTASTGWLRLDQMYFEEP